MTILCMKLPFSSCYFRLVRSSALFTNTLIQYFSVGEGVRVLRPYKLNGRVLYFLKFVSFLFGRRGGTKIWMNKKCIKYSFALRSKLINTCVLSFQFTTSLYQLLIPNSVD
jgi:hypothetical protein